MKEHEKAALVAYPDGLPEAELPEQALGFRVQGYGMRAWTDLFTNRQLSALITLSDLVHEARARLLADGAEQAYSNAVATYLAISLSRIADYHNALCVWRSDPKNEGIGHLFARQTISMIWDFCEGNPMSDSSGNLTDASAWVSNVIDSLPPTGTGHVEQSDAAKVTPHNNLVATDPPYYDNVGYADLADFFYVWLRRSLSGIYPELLSTMLTPKVDELVADPFRHEDPEGFFEDGYTKVFTRLCEATPDGFPITVFYAFKQAEANGDGDHASTGWETLLEGMLKAGWTVTATWPVRTELGNRTRSFDSNALASSIVLACRPRSANAGFTDRRGLITGLRDEFPEALRKLEQSKVAPVDLRQAAIGPGMAVFSRYTRVNEPDGSPMRVRAALSLINQVLDEKLSQLEGNVSADTRFCVEWFKQFGFDPGPFGTADTLSRGIDTSVDGLERAGVLRSRAGKVKLLAVQEIPGNYDPAEDDRTSEWEICLHIAKRLQDQGADAAAQLMAAARDVTTVDLDDVRELAYLLYSIAEKKGRTEIALLFNNLGTSWTDLEDASRKMTGPVPAQGQLNLEFGSDDGDK